MLYALHRLSDPLIAIGMGLLAALCLLRCTSCTFFCVSFSARSHEAVAMLLAADVTPEPLDHSSVWLFVVLQKSLVKLNQ